MPAWIVLLSFLAAAVAVAAGVAFVSDDPNQRKSLGEFGRRQQRLLGSGLRFRIDGAPRWERDTASSLDLPVFPEGTVLACRVPAPLTSTRLTTAWGTPTKELWAPERTGALLAADAGCKAALVALRAKTLRFALEGDELVVRADVRGFDPTTTPPWPDNLEQQVLLLMADARAFVDAVEAAVKPLPPLPSSTFALPSSAPSSGSPLPIRGIES